MSAEVAIQKFSFPFSCAVKPAPQENVSVEGREQVQAKMLCDLNENQILSEPSPIAHLGALVHNENREQESTKPPSGGDMAVTHVLVCAEASQNSVVSRKSAFENLKVESEDQRPAAKRQLSSESAARTFMVVKKSAVRKEADQQIHLQQKKQVWQRVTPCAAVKGRRKHRKDLFTSSEVFHRLDSHVIRIGAEVRPTAFLF